MKQISQSMVHSLTRPDENSDEQTPHKGYPPRVSMTHSQDSSEKHKKHSRKPTPGRQKTDIVWNVPGKQNGGENPHIRTESDMPILILEMTNVVCNFHFHSSSSSELAAENP